MNAKIIVFTSPTCPHCPFAIKLAREIEKERSDVKVEEFSTATHEGRKKSAHYDVMSVPTIFVRGNAYPQNIGFRATPSKQRLNEAIDISLGLKNFEEKKKLGDRIKALFREKLGIKIKT